MERFLSIDIETTGLDEKKCQILEFSCVIGDFGTNPVDELPSFTRRFYYDFVIGESQGLAMNASLIADMYNRLGPYPWMSIDSLMGCFSDWADSQQILGYSPNYYDKPTVTGKNFASFDLRFLRVVPRFGLFKFHQRILDIGSLMFRPSVDVCLPDMANCCARLGVPFSANHNSLDDARAVISCIRAYYKLTK